MDTKTKNILLGFVIGLCINAIINENMRLLLIVYFCMIFFVRCGFTMFINLMSAKDLWFFYRCLTNDNLFDIKDTIVMSFDYNVVYNTVTVTRSVTSVLKTDKDKIETTFKKSMSIILFWDVLLHIQPVKIVFK